MARSIAFLPFLLLLLLLIVIPAAYAVTYTVGGNGTNGGWNTGINYGTWARGITFTTADSLVFNYDGTHQVDEVSAGDYASCNSANPINTNSDSPTTIVLSTAGTRYFICPRSNHCAQGMKLSVTVTAASTSPGSPSPPSGTTPSPPSGGKTPSPPSQTPGTPATSPPPPRASAATTFGGRSSFVVGSLVVLAAGLMG